MGSDEKRERFQAGVTSSGRIDQKDELAIVRIGNVGGWSGDVRGIGITIHADEVIREAGDLWVLTAYDDGFRTETLCFSYLVNEGAVTALYEGDPGLVRVGTVWAEVAERRTGKVGPIRAGGGAWSGKGRERKDVTEEWIAKLWTK